VASYSAQQYRAAIEAGLKHRQQEESLAAENERLRAEAERLRAALVEIDNSEFAGVVVKAIVRSALAGTEATNGAG
jgi:regulator of replication initiation timing